MLADDIRGAYYIALKDMRTYYFKPPNISWGIIFPLALILAFYLRTPGDVRGLVPGMAAMTALFGATSMEAIAITFEKRVGALERLLLAPISLPALLLGKVVGGTIFGLATGSVVLVWAVAGLGVGVARPLLALGTLAVCSFCFAALGAFVSVSVREIFEAQTLANLFRFPMVFISGVFVPVSSLPAPLRLLSRLMPLTYAVAGVRESLGGGEPAAVLGNMAILLGWGFALCGISTWMMGRELA